jgi:hypothetical protein
VSEPGLFHRLAAAGGWEHEDRPAVGFGR